MIVGMLIYLNTYYKADDYALAVLNNHPSIELSDNLTILKPSYATDKALIFYPGAKVEHTAYLPLLEKIQKQGMMVILVEMPFNMAIFDANAAEDIMTQFPDIKEWYMAGHSMGGAMASKYASENEDKIQGLILLGAYVYGDYPPSKALTVYGTFNDNLEEYIDYEDNIVIIEGGNHAQFGNYGPQKGDPPATITAEEQQNIAVEAIKNFIE